LIHTPDIPAHWTAILTHGEAHADFLV
jgi:hypothetical protein